jgi:hypothetical protein
MARNGPIPKAKANSLIASVKTQVPKQGWRSPFTLNFSRSQNDKGAMSALF